jgi:hypothetical protein
MKEYTRIAVIACVIITLLSACNESKNAEYSSAITEQGAAVVVNVDRHKDEASSGDNTWNASIVVTNEFGEGLKANVIVKDIAEKEVKNVYTNDSGTISLALQNDSYTIIVSHDGYNSQTQICNKNDNRTLKFALRKAADKPQPFTLRGWSAWGGININYISNNIIDVSGNIIEAGFANERLPSGIAGSVLILEVLNSAGSEFSEGRMFKLTYGKADKTLEPENEITMLEGYISAADDSYKYVIPEDFGNKLGIVFYHANLKDLKITAYIEQK